MRILVVEDEPKLNSFISKGLEQQGYSVSSVTTGSDALNLVVTESFDLIILDVMLPGQSGFEVLENLKRFGVKIPVIIVSALNSSERVIEGLDKGAIDYIKKPFDFGEFLARVRAVTRKDLNKNFTNYRIGHLELDLLARKVLAHKQEVELTRREFALLELMILNSNRVISKTEIAEKVWEASFDMGSNVIEVHLSQLRKKLGQPDLIQTKVGIGYYIQGELLRK